MIDDYGDIHLKNNRMNNPKVLKKEHLRFKMNVPLEGNFKYFMDDKEGDR